MTSFTYCNFNRDITNVAELFDIQDAYRSCSPTFANYQPFNFPIECPISRLRTSFRTKKYFPRSPAWEKAKKSVFHSKGKEIFYSCTPTTGLKLRLWIGNLERKIMYLGTPTAGQRFRHWIGSIYIHWKIMCSGTPTAGQKYRLWIGNL